MRLHFHASLTPALFHTSATQHASLGYIRRHHKQINNHMFHLPLLHSARSSVPLSYTYRPATTLIRRTCPQTQSPGPRLLHGSSEELSLATSSDAHQPSGTPKVPCFLFHSLHGAIEAFHHPDLRDIMQKIGECRDLEIKSNARRVVMAKTRPSIPFEAGTQAVPATRRARIALLAKVHVFYCFCFLFIFQARMLLITPNHNLRVADLRLGACPFLHTRPASRATMCTRHEGTNDWGAMVRFDRD